MFILILHSATLVCIRTEIGSHEPAAGIARLCRYAVKVAPPAHSKTPNDSTKLVSLIKPESFCSLTQFQNRLTT